MILSGRDIDLYIKDGLLKIYPLTSQDQFQQNGIDLILDKVEYKGGSGHFYLGCTKETLELPNVLMAFVEIRSTWARRGLFMPPTIVDAGFKGNLTLEILDFSHTSNKGNLLDDGKVVGERFAHLIFAKTAGPCSPYKGIYSNQTGITSPPVDKV